MINYVDDKKHDTNQKNQNDEINEFRKNVKLDYDKNLIKQDDFYNSLSNDKTIKLIDTNKINCSILNKTNTKLYISKYKNSKLVFDNFNNSFNKIDHNLLLNYDNLLVVFDTNTNKNYYHKILCDTKNNKILDYYNDKYKFNFNNGYEMLSSSIKLNYSNNNLLKSISNFILDYTLNFLQIKKISKKTIKEIMSNVLDKLSNIKKEKNIINANTNYEKKYIKYKLKYLEFKKAILLV